MRAGVALVAAALALAAPAAAQDQLHQDTLRADPTGLASSALPEAPGLMTGEAASIYVSCVAVAPGVVLRSDVVPLGARTLHVIELRWSAYVQARAPTAVGRRCEQAHAAGKAAAYADLDARVRRLERQSGADESRYTGWRG